VTEELSASKKKFQLVLHPAAFAILPVSKYWETCVGSFMLSQFLEIFAVLIIFSLLSFLFFWLCFRKDTNRAGLASTLLVAIFYFWFPFLFAVVHLPWAKGLDFTVIAVIYILLWCQFSVGFLKFSKKLPLAKITDFLNVLSWALVLSAVIPALLKENELEQATAESIKKIRSEFKDVKLSTANGRPDIYYIVVDSFPNPHTLKELFQYESELVRYLYSKGFTVLDRAVSNHDRTELSVTSSLNMRLMLDIKNRGVLYQLLQRNELASLLKSIGYKFVNVSSSWEPTNFNPYADVNVSNGISNNFNVTLMQMTLLGAFEKSFHLMGNIYRDARLRSVNDRELIKAIPGPKFVLFHTLLAHPPYFMDEQGNARYLPPEMISYEGCPPRDEYLAQVKFSDRRLIELLDTLLSDTTKYNPIIIIQSDHGTATQPDVLERSYINERMRILSAFHLCPPVTAVPPNGISPVNNFRWILDHYFDAKLPLLPDDVYIAVPFEDGFNPKKVNDMVSFPERGRGK
jgi:hypothetical protein